MKISAFWRRSDPVDSEREQLEAIEWLRASVITESGPAFMPNDRRRCRLLLAYIDRLAQPQGAPTDGSHG